MSQESWNHDRQSRTVKRRFSAAAETYDGYAHVQRNVADKLMRMVALVQSPKRILEVGCGTGVLTRALYETFPEARIDATDISDQMIDRNRLNFIGKDRIHWHVADAKHFRSDVSYSLIVSNCALHWIDPLLDGFCNLASMLEPGGKLMFSVMLHDTLRELHALRAAIAPHKPTQGRLPRINEVADSVALTGLRVIECVEESETEIYPSAREFLHSLHARGLTGGAVSQSEVPLNRTELQRLSQEYAANYREDGRGVYATYNVGYIMAVKEAAP